MSARWSIAVAGFVLTAGLLGCGKDGQPGSMGGAEVAPATAGASGAGVGAGTATVPVAGTGTGSGIADAVATAANSLVVVGSYEAKLAAVRTPADAPKFDDVVAGALGAGEIAMELPAGDGEITGKTSGALGAQVFRGMLEAGWLGGVLRGEGDNAMWGYLDATVTGAGDARIVVGTLRVSSGDGRVVRESAFTLKKK